MLELYDVVVDHADAGRLEHDALRGRDVVVLGVEYGAAATLRAAYRPTPPTCSPRCSPSSPAGPRRPARRHRVGRRRLTPAPPFGRALEREACPVWPDS